MCKEDFYANNRIKWNYESVIRAIKEADFFLKLFFTQEGTPHILRFDF
jgi:hypothetical protein